MLTSHEAKKAKAAAAARDLTEEEIEEDEDDALLTTLAPGGEIEARHHTGLSPSLALLTSEKVLISSTTEAQIAVRTQIMA